MRLAPYGWSTIIKLIALTAIFGSFGAFIQPWFYAPAIAFGLLLAIVLYFYRDPERNAPQGDHLVISPADGQIVKIERVQDTMHRGGEALQISVFMNLFSVHVNRYPTDGKVDYLFYHPGKFLAAWNDKASTENEYCFIGLSTKYGAVGFKQIAGLVARRIVCHAKVGDIAERGKRFGMIKLGSRVDVLLPLSATPSVKIGQWVKAGESILASLK